VLLLFCWKKKEAYMFRRGSLTSDRF